MANLNAWRFSFNVVGVCAVPAAGEEYNPCKDLLFPYLIGDTIFEDLNGNGVQDPGEPGIPGVTVNLLDSNGLPVLDIYNNPITAVTDADGKYSFNVQEQTFDQYTNELIHDGMYTVQVDASNFAPGAPLAGLTSTTGGEQQTNTVIDTNVLTYDFGYGAPCPNAALIAGASLLTGASGTVAPCTYENPGTGTIGYWKTHPESWPVSEILIGGQIYTRDQAIAIMGQPGKGDKTYNLFAQLVAAKLNVLIGNDPTCVAGDIAAADAWLAVHPVGSKVKASSAAWESISTSFTNLDNYNNGQLCAPHRN
ncbi:MAG: SdrD B-like domain-containing protein [Chloroflexota bacterium]